MESDEMREMKRIYETMALITMIWETQPDTRFNQLVSNLQTEFSYKHDTGRVEVYEKEDFKPSENVEFVTYRKTSYIDLFNVEDDAFIEFLNQKMLDIRKK